MLTYGHTENTIENSEVSAQTPPFTGGVWAGTALFSMANLGAYAGTRVKFITGDAIPESTLFNSFSAKLKIVVLDYFHNQYFKIF